VYGFGARLPGYTLETKSSHCFALNGDFFSPEIIGIDNVSQCYQKGLKSLKLHGPTYFSKIIKNVNDMADFDKATGQFRYYILLIITDGNINDFNDTVDEIVRGTALPLSIIIVGVGDEDFKEMDELDADTKPLYSQKLQKQMERDIVQFVPFQQFKNDQNELAKEVLEEIPGQLTSYMASKNIKPENIAQMKQMNAPDFFQNQKTLLVEKALKAGIPQSQLDILFQKGIPDENIDLLLMQANNPYYINPLKQ
jgi:hypothetical protein